MSQKKTAVHLVIWALLAGVLWTNPTDAARDNKVLVVMSYEETNPWCREIKEGIESVFKENIESRYFYMNTKINLKGGPAKAREALAIIDSFAPDAIIAADDNAQSMLVVPHIKDRMDLPVIFCGVNADPASYGYPAKNITGILERNFIGQSIALAKQLMPAVNTVGFLVKKSPSGMAIFNQVTKEADQYLAKSTGVKLVGTIHETLRAIEYFKRTSDVLYVAATNGIMDENDRPMDNREITRIIAKTYGKPMIGANSFHVRYGVLCAVVKSGQTQGKTAAQMVLRAIGGTAVADIPITKNKYGKRMINVAVMQSLGIKPKRRAMVGTELIKRIE